MKKMRGLLAAALALTLVCASFVTVSASKFSDVSEKNYSWCINEISAMSEDGIINGYPGGLYKPENTVTKLEALCLVARVLGSNREINAGLIETAKDIYGEKIDGYALNFGTDEIAYLLMKGVIFEEELDDYLASGAANEGMKRYEVAILLTKGMGAEEEIKDKVPVLDYTDTLQIPSSARRYVEYVTSKGFMQGMGDNTFAPLNDVTRAQSALVLYKLQNLTKGETFKAVVAAYDVDSRTIRFKLADDSDKSYTILPANVKLRCDGVAADPKDIKVGWEAVVTLRDDMLSEVDFTSAMGDGVVSGRLISVIRGSGSSTLKIQDMASANKTEYSYKTDESVVITYDGGKGTMSDLAVGDYVTLTLKNGKIIIINGEAANKTVKGVITAIDLTNGVSLTIKTNDVDVVYPVSANVNVAKNGDVSSMSDVLVGDRVTLKLEYNVVKSLEATSTTKSHTGIIKAVNISDAPTIEIKIGTETYKYSVARNAKVLMDGVEGGLSDLADNINTNVTITLESDSVVKIEATSVADNTDVQGEVLSVNTSYNLIQVKCVDKASGTENTEQVFLKDGARIIATNSSTDKKLKDVQVGQTITAIGSRSTGVFEATTIIIRN